MGKVLWSGVTVTRRFDEDIDKAVYIPMPPPVNGFIDIDDEVVEIESGQKVRISIEAIE